MTNNDTLNGRKAIFSWPVDSKILSLVTIPLKGFILISLIVAVMGSRSVFE